MSSCADGLLDEPSIILVRMLETTCGLSRESSVLETERILQVLGRQECVVGTWDPSLTSDGMPRVPNLSSQYIVLIRYSCCMLSTYVGTTYIDDAVTNLTRMAAVSKLQQKRAVAGKAQKTHWAEVVCDLRETPAMLVVKYQEGHCLPDMLQLVPCRSCVLFTVTGSATFAKKKKEEEKGVEVKQLLLSTEALLKQSEDAITSSVSQKHQCSSSSSPAFTYSPLLNEQHSRRSRRLQSKEMVLHT